MPNLEQTLVAEKRQQEDNRRRQEFRNERGKKKNEAVKMGEQLLVL